MHRSKKKRNIIIFSLAGILLCMVVGYAAFQTKLEIKGTSKVTSNWNIQITNVTDGTSTGSAENASNPSWTDLTAYMETNLYNKGDAIEYDVTIENKGTIDAKLNDVLTNLEKENNEAVIITFSGYTKGEVLKSGESKIVHIKIEYNPSYEGEETSSEVKIDFEYTQNNNNTENPDDKYLVTYDCTTNGGNDCSSNNEYKLSGSLVDLNKLGSKQGFNFIGWNTDKDAQEALNELTIENSNITLYAIFKDETPPTCDLKVTKATVNTVSVIANCEDISGISKYQYSINDNGYIDNGENKEYVFNSFNLSTIKLKATDGESNSAEFTFNEKSLEEGYQIIYDALNNEYKKMLDKKETYENDFLNKTYPIGSIYITNSNQNPSSTLGGVWKEYSKGKALTGVDEEDVNFDTINKTGGTSSNYLGIINMTSHKHGIPTLLGNTTSSGIHNHIIPSLTGTTNTTGNHVHTYVGSTNSTNYGAGHGLAYASHQANWGATMPGSSAGDHSHTVTTDESVTGENGAHTHDVTIPESETETVGTGTAFTNLQPYITVYMYKRVA